jgi:hypothetical protein
LVLKQHIYGSGIFHLLSCQGLARVSMQFSSDSTGLQVLLFKSVLYHGENGNAVPNGAPRKPCA